MCAINDWWVVKERDEHEDEEEDEETKEGVETATCRQVVRVAVAQVPFANL